MILIIVFHENVSHIHWLVALGVNNIPRPLCARQAGFKALYKGTIGQQKQNEITFQTNRDESILIN